jgi:hypothetical protein
MPRWSLPSVRAGRLSRLGMAHPDLVGVWGGALEGERARTPGGGVMVGE